MSYARYTVSYGQGYFYSQRQVFCFPWQRVSLLFAMFTPRKKAALRRMKLEELMAKMEQSEEQASLTLHEYPHGHTRERQRLVMAIAKQVRSHLVDQLEAGVRESLASEREVTVRVIDGGKSTKPASS
jgi:hypothetical protein